MGQVTIVQWRKNGTKRKQKQLHNYLIINLSLIHISEPTRRVSQDLVCRLLLEKKKKKTEKKKTRMTAKAKKKKKKQQKK